MADWIGELPDWRLVRICSVLVAYLLGQNQPASSKMSRADLNMYKIGHIKLQEVIINAARVAGMGVVPMKKIPNRELCLLRKSLTDYIYSGGDSTQLATRRRLSFLVSLALTQRDFVLCCVHMYLTDQETQPPPDNTPLLSYLSLLLLGVDNALQVNAVAEELEKFLRVTADIICGVWRYLDLGEGDASVPILHSMIETIIDLQRDTVQDIPPVQSSTSSLPCIIRLRDIIDICALPGLDVAIAPFLQ
ncbi:hypothetical protein BGZ94_003920 [Podila epigama]|nr:hypothetical protein BGZ94_003920 [Podila epigama]